MSLYLDASALVAILAREPEAETFANRIEWETDRLTSAVSLWEACRGLANARGLSFEEARGIVSDYVGAFGIRIVPIGDEEAGVALDAYRDFGRGRHPAALNMGDCFSYACAKRHARTILFKGEDFVHTDLEDATLS